MWARNSGGSQVNLLNEAAAAAAAAAQVHAQAQAQAQVQANGSASAVNSGDRRASSPFLPTPAAPNANPATTSAAAAAYYAAALQQQQQLAQAQPLAATYFAPSICDQQRQYTIATTYAAAQAHQAYGRPPVPTTVAMAPMTAPNQAPKRTWSMRPGAGATHYRMYTVPAPAPGPMQQQVTTSGYPATAAAYYPHNAPMRPASNGAPATTAYLLAHPAAAAAAAAAARTLPTPNTPPMLEMVSPVLSDVSAFPIASQPQRMQRQRHVYAQQQHQHAQAMVQHGFSSQDSSVAQSSNAADANQEQQEQQLVAPPVGPIMPSPYEPKLDVGPSEFTTWMPSAVSAPPNSKDNGSVSLHASANVADSFLLPQPPIVPSSTTDQVRASTPDDRGKSMTVESGLSPSPLKLALRARSPPPTDLAAPQAQQQRQVSLDHPAASAASASLPQSQSHSSAASPAVDSAKTSPASNSPTPKVGGKKSRAANSSGAESKKRQFPCQVEGCGKVFTSSGHLHRHERSIHGREKPFSCPFPGCDARFTRNDNRWQHYRTHFCARRQYKHTNLPSIPPIPSEDEIAKLPRRGRQLSGRVLMDVSSSKTNSPAESPAIVDANTFGAKSSVDAAGESLQQQVEQQQQSLQEAAAALPVNTNPDPAPMVSITNIGQQQQQQADARALALAGLVSLSTPPEPMEPPLAVTSPTSTSALLSAAQALTASTLQQQQQQQPIPMQHQPIQQAMLAPTMAFLHTTAAPMPIPIRRIHPSAWSPGTANRHAFPTARTPAWNSYAAPHFISPALADHDLPPESMFSPVVAGSPLTGPGMPAILSPDGGFAPSPAESPALGMMDDPQAPPGVSQLHILQQQQQQQLAQLNGGQEPASKRRRVSDGQAPGVDPRCYDTQWEPYWQSLFPDQES